MQSDLNHIAEAELIGYYLLGIAVGDSEKQTYVSAMEKLSIQFSDYEKGLWEYMIRSKRSMAFVDAGLALKDPNNNVRRKIFTMLAILEASPNYSSYFLSREFSAGYVLKVGWVGIRAILKAAVGILIIKSIKRKCS